MKRKVLVGVILVVVAILAIYAATTQVKIATVPNEASAQQTNLACEDLQLFDTATQIESLSGGLGIVVWVSFKDYSQFEKAYGQTIVFNRSSPLFYYPEGQSPAYHRGMLFFMDNGAIVSFECQ